MNLLTI